MAPIWRTLLAYRDETNPSFSQGRQAQGAKDDSSSAFRLGAAPVRLFPGQGRLRSLASYLHLPVTLPSGSVPWLVFQGSFSVSRLPRCAARWRQRTPELSCCAIESSHVSSPPVSSHCW